MPMDSSTAQSHHQGLIQVEVGGSETLESMLASTKAVQQEKKPRPAEQSLKCPRCESTNTKFCYYNNYSLSQPRYFCKSCRRYWTKGGTLRNVPVGGGCRKAKRSSSSSTSSRRNPISIPTSHPAPAPIPSYAYNADLVDALRGSGFHENNIPRFENPYNGNGNHILGLEMGMGMGMGIGVLNHEMGMMGFEEFGGSEPVKQEMCSSGDKWGFPWQNVVGGDGSSTELHHLDSIRNINAAWNVNGIASSTWHGLLNSPLM